MRKYVETEDKFDVGEEWVLPQVTALVPAGGRLDQVVAALDSTYFDTADAALRLFGVTLRRRVGGGETGWQLKVPNGTSRVEIRSGARAKRIPKALSEAVAGLLAGDTITPVATLTTSRTAYRISDSDGRLILEIADDTVASGPATTELPVRTWRQIEVELGPGGKKKHLKKAAKLLTKADATPSSSRNKLDQALGPIPATPEAGYGAGTGSLGDLVGDYVAAQCEVLVSNDVGLRTGDNLVHKTRVAARRLRSTVRVFGDLFDPAAAADLDDELVWYAEMLGQVRDRDVLSRRLTDQVAALPSEYVRGPVDAEIQRILHHERDIAFDRLRNGMDADRYRNLIRLLRSWRTAPPFTAAAGTDKTEVGDYVSRAKKKADKRLRNADNQVERLHRARKAIKRLRYAAELGTPASPDLAAIATDAKHLQTVLGDHQDATVSAHFLTVAAPTNSTTAFTYGVLTANELAEAARIRANLKH